MATPHCETAGIDDRSKAQSAEAQVGDGAEAAGTGGTARRRESTTEARRPRSHEVRASRRSRVPTNGDSTFGPKARMVEAAGIEPASESVPQKALQA